MRLTTISLVLLAGSLSCMAQVGGLVTPSISGGGSGGSDTNIISGNYILKTNGVAQTKLTVSGQFESTQAAQFDEEVIVYGVTYTTNIEDFNSNPIIQADPLGSGDFVVGNSSAQSGMIYVGQSDPSAYLDNGYNAFLAGSAEFYLTGNTGSGNNSCITFGDAGVNLDGDYACVVGQANNGSIESCYDFWAIQNGYAYATNCGQDFVGGYAEDNGVVMNGADGDFIYEYGGNIEETNRSRMATYNSITEGANSISDFESTFNKIICNAFDITNVYSSGNVEMATAGVFLDHSTNNFIGPDPLAVGYTNLNNALVGFDSETIGSGGITNNGDEFIGFPVAGITTNFISIGGTGIIGTDGVGVVITNGLTVFGGDITTAGTFNINSWNGNFGSTVHSYRLIADAVSGVGIAGDGNGVSNVLNSIQGSTNAPVNSLIVRFWQQITNTTTGAVGSVPVYQ